MFGSSQSYLCIPTYVWSSQSIYLSLWVLIHPTEDQWRHNAWRRSTMTASLGAVSRPGQRRDRAEYIAGTRSITMGPGDPRSSSVFSGFAPVLLADQSITTTGVQDRRFVFEIRIGTPIWSIWTFWGFYLFIANKCTKPPTCFPGRWEYYVNSMLMFLFWLMLCEHAAIAC
jgi:hypothetical protein